MIFAKSALIYAMTFHISEDKELLIIMMSFSRRCMIKPAPYFTYITQLF